MLRHLDPLLRGHAGALRTHDPILQRGDDGPRGQLPEDAGAGGAVAALRRMTPRAPLREERLAFPGEGRGACDEPQDRCDG